MITHKHHRTRAPTGKDADVSAGFDLTGRFWYEKSAREALRIAQGDYAKAEKFIGLLAIYSPQNRVFSNTSMAIKAYTQY